jgi:hypothetical protein
MLNQQEYESFKPTTNKERWLFTHFNHLYGYWSSAFYWHVGETTKPWLEMLIIDDLWCQKQLKNVFLQRLSLVVVCETS